jgi:alpha-ketoglutarate-dependent 2,4-dichlorophenoxyacetate dioxygenase
VAIAIEPLHPLFAAQAGGVDLSRPLAEAARREIVAAMDRYAVLVFRGQQLDEDQQIACARQFGPLDEGLRKIRKGQPHRFRHHELADISNVTVDGSVAARDHAKIVNNIANQLWHSDSSFQKPAARYSMLHAVTIPDRGGETEFADLRAAWDALPGDLQREVAGLQAEHYLLHSRFMLGDTGYTEEQKKALPPVTWPLLRTHPGSGRKLLWVGIHATHVVGMTVPEGRMLLMDLLEHATQRQFVYQHRWQVGDLVMWDNRAVLHRGRRFDLSQRREMRRATTEDAGQSLEDAA